LYSYKNVKNTYNICDNDELLLTPMGRTVESNSLELSKRLIEDLEEYGESPGNPESLVAFHYPMIDFFKTRKRENLQYSVEIGLSPEEDWTLQCSAPDPNIMMKWWDTFGRAERQIPKGRKWLDTLKLNQLCAVTVLGNVMKSVNIPFVLATKDVSAEEYAKMVVECQPYLDEEIIVKYFKNFRYYYSLDKDPV